MAEIEQYILGISAFYHDSAACLVKNGEIIAAAQEERFTRIKHDSSFPAHAIQYCLREGGIISSDLRYVAFYDKPFLKFERILFTYFQYAPRGLRSFLKAMPLWLKEKLYIKEFWDFLRVRKRYWLAPIVIILLLLSLLIVFAQSSSVAPFVYTLF